jgi:His-Xaa-Ser system protein HxsD
VLRAAYWLTDRYYVHVNKTGAGTIIAEIRTKDGRNGPELTAACGTFCNSLIDFALRARVTSETQDIQRALVQRAFIELLPKAVSRA